MPHCVVIGKVPDGAQNISTSSAVASMDECYDMCVSNGTSCRGWLYTTDKDDASQQECMLYGEATTPISWVDFDSGNKTAYFANSDCIKSTSKQPAMAEDAEELSYIEICKKNQFKEEFKQNNTWDLDYCPSNLNFSSLTHYL